MSINYLSKFNTDSIGHGSKVLIIGRDNFKFHWFLQNYLENKKDLCVFFYSMSDKREFLLSENRKNFYNIDLSMELPNSEDINENSIVIFDNYINTENNINTLYKYYLNPYITTITFTKNSQNIPETMTNYFNYVFIEYEKNFGNKKDLFNKFGTFDSFDIFDSVLSAVVNNKYLIIDYHPTNYYFY